MSLNMVRELVFPQDEAPKTVENFLKKRFPIGYVRRLFRKNGLRLNGQRCKPSEIAAPGDVLQLFIPFASKFPVSTPKAPQQPALDIGFENEDLLVINKPAGLAVHEGKGILTCHSLIGALQARFASTGVKPKLVHRLDKETSGLVLVAKNDAAAAELQFKFENGQVDKEYLALVVGRIRPRAGRIELPLRGRDGNLVRAVTAYRLEKQFTTVALLQARIQTGRMHQIRLHLANIGHPIVMDSRHGDFAFNKAFRKAHPLKRQFLHASALALEHKGHQWRWTAPLPEDLARTLASLRSSTVEHHRNPETA